QVWHPLGFATTKCPSASRSTSFAEELACLRKCCAPRAISADLEQYGVKLASPGGILRIPCSPRCAQEAVKSSRVKIHGSLVRQKRICGASLDHQQVAEKFLGGKCRRRRHG